MNDGPSMTKMCVFFVVFKPQHSVFQHQCTSRSDSRRPDQTVHKHVRETPVLELKSTK